MRKKIFIPIIGVVILAGIVFGMNLIKKNKNSSVKYSFAKVDRGDIEALVVTSGSMNPVTVVDVGSQVSGKIAKIYVDFNSPVKKGQLLAELDQSLFITRVNQNEANYKSAVAALEKAKVTLENTKRKRSRAISLFEQELISFEEKEDAEAQYFSAAADLQSSEARLEQAKSQLESSQVDLAYTVIRSPIDGIAINRNINEGQTVAASFQAPVLFQIANDLSQMQVECSVDEADIGKVREGQRARFTVDAFPDEIFTGRVNQVRYSPEVVQNVVTYTTIVDVDNPEMRLRPGMTATVSIIIGEAKNALRVPNSALRFMPQLSPEEMEKIFKSFQEKKGESPEDQLSSSGLNEKKSQESSGRRIAQGQERKTKQFAMGGPGSRASRMNKATLVWIQGKDGLLRPVFIKAGVTDNTFTEVLQGNLEEGQQVILNASGGETGQNPNRSPLGRSMVFIRR